VELGRVGVAAAALVGAADLSFGDRSGEAEAERPELLNEFFEAALVLVGVGLGVFVGRRGGSVRELRY
jgi:hypothetical protein